MATAEEYAGWIVKNQDKKGTPEFETVAQAYRIARQDTSGQNQQNVSLIQPQQPEQPPASMGERALGALSAVRKVGMNIMAEPVAGIAGLGAAIIPGGRDGSEMVERVRGMVPAATPEGERILSETVAPVVAPVGRALSATENYLGNTALDATGSPALAAAAHTIPTAIMEALGAGASRRGARVAKNADDATLMRQLTTAAPAADELKEVSRSVFREIDELGGTVDPQRYRSLASQVRREAVRMGSDAQLTPKADRALRRFLSNLSNYTPLSELERLREQAQIVAEVPGKEGAIGKMMIQKIDDFLDDPSGNVVRIPQGDAGNIGARYRVARELWGRARRSETIQEAIEKARDQASGFENGIRIQFRAILNSPKKSKFFRPDELEAMRDVVRGTPGANLAKLIGRFGFSERNATNIVGGSIGAGGGAYAGSAFGPMGSAVGAVTLPLVGQVSRKLAQRMTYNNAQFADAVIRAGRDAKKIVAAYNANTPAALRSAEELSELLIRQDIDLANLGDQVGIVAEAARLARTRRNALGAAAATGATTQQKEQE